MLPLFLSAERHAQLRRMLPLGALAHIVLDEALTAQVADVPPGSLLVLTGTLEEAELEVLSGWAQQRSVQVLIVPRGTEVHCQPGDAEKGGRSDLTE